MSEEEAQHESYDYQNVSGNYYDKYNSKNPLAKMLMQGFLTSFDELVNLTHAKSALEVGCGEGYLSMRMLRREISVTGIDLERDAIDQAERMNSETGLRGSFSVRDVYDLDQKDSKELVVCCEVLEHLPAPERALETLVALANPWLVLSVPREPIWRGMNVLRGKYLSDLGNTPGHIQHWRKRAFLQLVSTYAKIEQVRSPLPWTMVLCRCD